MKETLPTVVEELKVQHEVSIADLTETIDELVAKAIPEPIKEKHSANLEEYIKHLKAGEPSLGPNLSVAFFQAVTFPGLGKMDLHPLRATFALRNKRFYPHLITSKSTIVEHIDSSQSNTLEVNSKSPFFLDNWSPKLSAEDRDIFLLNVLYTGVTTKTTEILKLFNELPTVEFQLATLAVSLLKDKLSVDEAKQLLRHVLTLKKDDPIKSAEEQEKEYKRKTSKRKFELIVSFQIMAANPFDLLS